jgi:hypothetical protein
MNPTPQTLSFTSYVLWAIRPTQTDLNSFRYLFHRTENLASIAAPLTGGRIYLATLEDALTRNKFHIISH